MAIKKFTPQNSDLFIGKDQGDHTLGKFGHLNYLLQQINAIDAEVPDQAGHAGEYLTTDGVNTSWAAVPTSRLSNTSIRNMANNETLVIQTLPNGAITDGVLSVTKNGAMTTATISKVGQFDKLAVTGGNYTSYIKFNDFFIGDQCYKIKATIKVENLNKDGATGTSYLGFSQYGTQLTQDTGTVYNGGLAVELIGKTAIRNGFNANGSAVSSPVVSAGTLVASGDVLDLEMQLDPLRIIRTLKVINRSTGEYVYASHTGSTTSFGIITSTFGIIATNADYTLLDVKLYSSVTKPIMGFIGDSYGVGYNQTFSTTLTPICNNSLPYEFVTCCGNGGYIYTMANRQMQEIMKTKPTFVVLVTVLSLFYGDFKVTDPDYTNWYAAYNKIIKEVVNYGGIPVMIKWPPGPYTNNNTTQWNAFIDAEVLLNPTMQVLDLTGYSFTYSDNSHPSAADYQLILQSVDALLAANGY